MDIADLPAGDARLTRYTVEEIREIDFSHQLEGVWKGLTEEEDRAQLGEDVRRPCWSICNGRGAGTGAKMAVPWKIGCWSYQGDMHCRYRYAIHLLEHGAHKVSKTDAMNLAFDYDQTKTDIAWETRDERCDWRHK